MNKKRTRIHVFKPFLLLLIISIYQNKVYSQTWDEIIKLTASDGEENDMMGVSIDISGNTAIVGAHGNSDEGYHSGSAYIFEPVDGVWTEVVKLTASDAADGDSFGQSVAISGTTAIISAHGSGEPSFGAAYIFEKIGDVWTETAKLEASDGAFLDQFGWSVDISDDIAIIGAYGNDDDGDYSGSAYIFELSGGTWSEVVKLTASDAEEDDNFGEVVRISGTRAIVGASFADDDGTSSGSAYIFELSGGTWDEVVKLTASDASALDYFGESVDISGTQAIVGASGNNNIHDDAGSAYIFELEDGVWTEVVKLTASDADEDNRFGRAVSISETTAIIGVKYDDDEGFGTGSAYVFELEDGAWTEEIKLIASDAMEFNNFGYSVAISGHTIGIGAMGYSDTGNPGAAYIFEICPALDLTASVDVDEICLGESVTFTAEGEGTFEWDFDIVDGEPYEPLTAGLENYTVTVTVDSTGCVYTSSVSVNAIVLDVIATADDVEICLGDVVTFNGEGADTYTWDMEVTDGEPFEPLDLGTETYTVTGSTDIGCVNTSSIIVTVYENPVVTAIVDDSEICLGDVITFNGIGGETYTWDLGVTDGELFEPLSVGTETYTVIGTDDNGCVDSADVAVTVYDNPDVTATVDDSEICLGDQVIFNGDGAETYSWDLDVIDGVSFEPMAVGTTTYTVIGEDDNGCIGSASVAVTVNQITISYTTIDELFGGDGEINITVSGGTPAYTFDWDNDETGDFDDDQDLSGLIGGTFIVVVEDEDGCSATETVTVNSQLGIAELIDVRLSVYPNPFTDFATISFGKELIENHTIVIHDILGKEIYRNEAVTGMSLKIKKQDLGVGVYVLSLFNANSKELFSAKLLVE